MKNEQLLEFVKEYCSLIDLAVKDSPDDIQQSISDKEQRLKYSELVVLEEELKAAIPALGFIPIAGLSEEKADFITPIYLMRYKVNDKKSKFWHYLEIMRRQPDLEGMSEAVADEINNKISLVRNEKRDLIALLKVPFLTIASMQPELFDKYFANRL